MAKHMKTAWIQFFAVVLLLLAPAVIATRVYADPPEIRVISVTVGEEFDIEECDWSYYEQEQVLKLMQKRRPMEDLAILHERVEVIWKTAAKYNLRPTQIAKIVDEESRFNPRAVSWIWDKKQQKRVACAFGYMQINRKYHKLNDYFDFRESLDYGCCYYRAQLDRFGDEALALAAYNAGPGRVARLGAVPNISETQKYVKAVLAGEKKLRGMRG